MTIDGEADVYMDVKEAAAAWGVDFQWLRRMARDGYVPRRMFDNSWILHQDDKPVIDALHTRATRILPEPEYADMPVRYLGITLTEMARRAGTRFERARRYYNAGVLQPIAMVGQQPVFDESAVEALKAAVQDEPHTQGRKRKDVSAMAHVEMYKRGVPPLTAREEEIVQLYDGGLSFDEVGQRLRISRARAHAIHRRALLKQRLLEGGAGVMPPPTRKRTKPLKVKDKAILQRVLEGKSNAEIAADLDKSGVTEATVAQRLRNWARFAEKEAGTRYERVPLATYILTKYGVLQYDTTAA